MIRSSPDFVDNKSLTNQRLHDDAEYEDEDEGGSSGGDLNTLFSHPFSFPPNNLLPRVVGHKSAP